MNEATLELARAAVASPHWRWMPGMLVVSTNNYHRPARIESLDGDTYGLTVVPHANGPVFAAHHEYGIAGEFPRGSSVPDFDDPATRGCLLALVREKIPALAVYPPSVLDENEEWSLEDRDGAFQCDAPTEAAALVAALLAAPAKEVER